METAKRVTYRQKRGGRAEDVKLISQNQKAVVSSQSRQRDWPCKVTGPNLRRKTDLGQMPRMLRASVVLRRLRYTPCDAQANSGLLLVLFCIPLDTILF